MAARGQSFLVDQHPEKQKIIDGILSGQPVRDIARSVSPPIGFNAIQRYKTRIVKPILGQAEETERLLGELQARPPAAPPRKASPAAIQKADTAIQDAPRLSMFRDRLEKLWQRADRTLDKAEAAVRVGEDQEGNAVFGARDITPIAPLLNAAHKSLELLGRATGELEPEGRQSIAIQIICPQAPNPGAMPRVSYVSADAIDAEDVCVEIGLIQR
jgi:hypothetical protein